MDLAAWRADDEDEEIEQTEESAEVPTTVTPIFEELNPDLILAAVERARESLSERRRFEYEVWLARKFKDLKCVITC